NILVTPSRRACIADFGLSSIASAVTLRFTHSTASARGGTARYQAPELFGGDKQHYASDVYALSCVFYEILTGQVPFHDLPNDMTVMFSIIQGKRPARPMSCSGTPALDALWELLQKCWDGIHDMRPAAPEIVKQLVGPGIRATTTSSTADWDDKFTSKFRRSFQALPLLPSVTQIECLLFGYSSFKVSHK
ncbi:kinase-like domain-containing protein, partial [Mycena capillaripes]